MVMTPAEALNARHAPSAINRGIPRLHGTRYSCTEGLRTRTQQQCIIKQTQDLHMFAMQWLAARPGQLSKRKDAGSFMFTQLSRARGMPLHDEHVQTELFYLSGERYVAPGWRQVSLTSRVRAGRWDMLLLDPDPQTALNS